MTGCVALIVAAGQGARFGAGPDPSAPPPKQYAALAGKPMLARAAAPFCAHDGIAAVRAVINPEDRPRYDDAVRGLDLMEPAAGGPRRQDSVRLGLESLSGAGFQTVLIHDAARPLVDAAVIGRTLAALGRHRAAIPAVPVTDSLKRAAGGVILDAPERAGLWRAQTPQGFAFDAILEAHRKAAGAKGRDFTDDAAVAAFAGIEAALVDGSEDNIKITTADDLARAERLIAGAGEIRTGQGLDAHAFGAEGTGPVRLCGVDIAHERGLAGHSDGDAGLHALADALYGALAEGDIGDHFPSTDADLESADSERFLRHAAERARARGAVVIHVDVTIVCAEPRIAPHRDAMRARVAAVLGIGRERVSVKATTSDGLGALGRGEGVAAQALATLRFERGAP